MIVSATTAWLTLLRPGRLRMTRPTLFYLGPDGGLPKKERPSVPKVYVRTLLFSTAKRGNLIENMYVTVRRGETRQNFNVWVYRQNGQLSRGSGLYVSQDGVALDHHFLLPSDGSRFEFIAGDYSVEVFAKLVGKSRPLLLSTVSAHLSANVAEEATENGGGVFFDWGPDRGSYYASTRPIPVTDDSVVPLTAAVSILDGILSDPGPRRER